MRVAARDEQIADRVARRSLRHRAEFCAAAAPAPAANASPILRKLRAAFSRPMKSSEIRTFSHGRLPGDVGGPYRPNTAPQEPKPSIPGENIVGDTQLTRVSGVPVTTLSDIDLVYSTRVSLNLRVSS